MSLSFKIIIFIIFIGKMQFKINFDQLFGQGNDLNTTQQTPLSQIQHSFHTINDSFQYQISLDPHLFQQAHLKDPSEALFINHDELDDPEESSEIPKSPKTSFSSPPVKAPRPGERLYYESQASLLRKTKERQRVEQQKQASIKSMPFSPAINQKSRKIAEKTRVQTLKADKPKKEVKTTQQIKEQQELKQCTFQPKVINKPLKAERKSKEELFYMLHNTSKIKELKLAQKAQEEARNRTNQKKMSESQFIEFLKRNQEYANLIKKKKEILKQSADMYDFKTGEKLYSPKISDSKVHHFPSTTSPKNYQSFQTVQPFKTLDQHSEPLPTCGIFRKKPNNLAKLGLNSLEENKHEQRTVNRDASCSKEEQVDYAEKYRQYSEEYDRRVALQETNQHVIPQQPEQQLPSSEGWQDKVEFSPQEKYQQNLWNSEENVDEQYNQIHEIEESKIRQFMMGSEQDEHEPRNNYVMEILTNLINHKNEDQQ